MDLVNELLKDIKDSIVDHLDDVGETDLSAEQLVKSALENIEEYKEIMKDGDL